MTDLLERGSQWLEAQRHKFLTRTVVYQRGEHSVQLQATVGNTVFRFDDAHGGVTRYVSRDFLIRTQDLVLDGEAVLPKRGDRIREPHSDQVHVHEVMGPGRSASGWLTFRMRARRTAPALALSVGRMPIAFQLRSARSV